MSNLIITDRVPVSATLIAAPGGTIADGVVRWEQSSLAPEATWQVQMVVSATQRAVNEDYALTTAETGTIPGTRPIVTLIDALQTYLPLVIRP